MVTTARLAALAALLAHAVLAPGAPPAHAIPTDPDDPEGLPACLRYTSVPNSARGTGHWAYLNASQLLLSQVTLGDVDGDGRCDVSGGGGV